MYAMINRALNKKNILHLFADRVLQPLMASNSIKPGHHSASAGYPQIGRPAPDFRGTAVIDGSFKEISLDDYRGKYLVLFFYPLDFTFVCPTEIIAFSNWSEEFLQIGCQLIACSSDSHLTHMAWISTPKKEGGLGSMKIPLLADKNGKICKQYRVYIEEDGIALRGLFIIDGKGILRQITINDLPVGRNVDEILRLVQALKDIDVNGKDCSQEYKFI